MNEQNNFSNIQRYNSAILAKCEWTSSLIGMQKTGDEIYDRRTKNNRKANQLLQDLLEKRKNGILYDDNGTIDRYYKFLKNRSYSNDDDDDDILNEFERRLRSLKNFPRRISFNHKKLVTNGSQTLFNSEYTSRDMETNVQSKANARVTSPNRLSKSSLSVSTMTDASDESQTNSWSLSTQHKTLTVKLSSTNIILHRPIARKIDGTEIIVSKTVQPFNQTSSNASILDHCYFPRSLKSRKTLCDETVSTSSFSSQLVKQFDKEQIYYLLDEIESNCSSKDFENILDQLTISSTTSFSTDNYMSFYDEPNSSNIYLESNLFTKSNLSHDYYATFTVKIDDTTKICLYTMTISTVQLSPSQLVPYSVLNGRRPYLKCSNETNFKQVRSKREKHISYVIGIDTLANANYVKENDIILKIDDQSVCHFDIEDVKNILKQANTCVLTIARLRQPFFSSL